MKGAFLVLSGAVVLGLAATLLFISCKSSDMREAIPSKPRVIFHPGTAAAVSFDVELAVTDLQRARGLMHRKGLDADRGMLFVFPAPQEQRYFWMKNTHIALDMIHISKELKVVGVIHDAVPHDTNSRGVGHPAKYVLEIRGGLARKHAIERGTDVKLVDVPSL